MADDTLPFTADTAPEPPPPAAVPPPAEPTPLDEAPLSEFVKRRAKGEQAVPSEMPEIDGEPDSAPDEKIPGKADHKAVPKTRFDQIYRQRSDAIRERDAEKARAAQLEAELQQLRQRPSADPQRPAAAEPVLDEYLAAGKSYEEWMDARIEFRAHRVADSRIQADRQRAVDEQAAAQRLEQLSGFGDRTEAAKAKYPNYDEVVVSNDRVQLSPVMTDIVTRSPNGPDIMYWLGTHEAEANQLGELTRQYGPAAYPLVEQHLLLLSGQSLQLTGAKKAVPVSHAPAPISPVGGGGSTSTVALDSMPLGDYVKRRNAADQKKRTG